MNPLMTVDDVAAYVQLKPKTIRNMVYSGRGPRSHRIGGRRRFRQADVDDWIKEHAADKASRRRRR